jgi:hypothetical protein
MGYCNIERLSSCHELVGTAKNFFGIQELMRKRRRLNVTRYVLIGN